MENNVLEFYELVSMFEERGYKLYLVGGTVRDYLLNKDLTDMDAVTDATPDEMKQFLLGADFTFAKMGSVKYKCGEVKFDITTLREEGNYVDSRHPSEIKFVKDLKIDVIRRDFTINGLYMDSNFKVLDYVDGISDLARKTIKMIGEPDKRIKEDPLRIVRAVRFALTLDFEIDVSLEKAMLDNKNLLKNLTKAKVIQDANKVVTTNESRKRELFDKFGITEVINMID